MTYEYWLRLLLPYVLFSLFLLPMCIEMYKGKKVYRKLDLLFVLAFLIYYAFTLGYREFSIGTDTIRYVRYFEEIGNFDNYSEYISYARNTGIGLFLFGKLIYIFSHDPSVFLFSVALLFIGLIVWASFEIGAKNKIIYLFSFASCFFFYSMGVNIIRDGVSLMLMLLGLIYWERGNKYKWVFVVFSVLFHFTSILLFIAYLLVKKISRLRKLKTAIILWLACVLLSVLGFGLKAMLSSSSIPIISDLIKTFEYSGYIENVKEGYQTGFRLDFTIFSAVFILLGTWMYKKFKEEDYHQLLCTFIYLNAFFIMAYDMQFSDRIGLLSWVLIPMLVSKPFYTDFTMMSKKILWWFLLMAGIGTFTFIQSYPQ